MDKEKHFFDKTTTIITIVCVFVISVVGTFLLKLESSDMSEIIKSDKSSKIEEAIDSAKSSKLISSGEYDASVYGLININTADKDLLMLLEGIGEKRAEDIIEYRQTTPFKRIEDIKKIDGIGQKTFDRIKNKICVE